MARKSNRGQGAGQPKQQGRPERMGRAGVTGEGYAMSASADSPKKQGDKLGPGKGTAAGKK